MSLSKFKTATSTGKEVAMRCALAFYNRHGECVDKTNSLYLDREVIYNTLVLILLQPEERYHEPEIDEFCISTDNAEIEELMATVNCKLGYN